MAPAKKIDRYLLLADTLEIGVCIVMVMLKPMLSAGLSNCVKNKGLNSGERRWATNGERPARLILHVQLLIILS